MAKAANKAKGTGSKGGSKKGRRQKQPPRRIPLIAQKRKVEGDGGKIEELSVGELIVRAVKIGAYKAQAAEAAGIRESTLYNWINRGEDAMAVALEKVEEGDEVTAKDVPVAERPYAEFVESLKRAEASAEVWHLANLRRHAEKNWTASAWYLERTKRDRYGRHTEQGSTVPSLIDMQAAVDAARKS